jgi:hypothetical protein
MIGWNAASIAGSKARSVHDCLAKNTGTLIKGSVLVPLLVGCSCAEGGKPADDLVPAKRYREVVTRTV